MKKLKLILFFVYLLSAVKITAHEAQVGCKDCSQIATPAHHLAQNVDDALCVQSVGSDQIAKNEYGAFRIKRIGNKKYIAEINPKFYGAPPGQDESYVSYALRSGETHSRFVEYMNICLKRYNPYLKGPNGEELEIQAVNDNKIPQVAIYIERDWDARATGLSKVDIDKKKFRSSVHNYAADIDCPSVLHEALHLMGLKDEYNEVSAGYILNPETGEHEFVSEGAAGYDCRVMGPGNSVMSDQYNAIQALQTLTIVEGVNCDCKQSEEACEKIIVDAVVGKQIKKGCPSGFTSNVYVDMIPSDKDLMQFEGMSVLDLKLMKDQTPENEYKISMYGDGTTGLDIPMKKTTQPPIRSTLLHPAHFRMITQPNCNKVNSTYKECTSIAYDTSEMNPSCMQITKKCQSLEDWLK